MEMNINGPWFHSVGLLSSSAPHQATTALGGLPGKGALLSTVLIFIEMIAWRRGYPRCLSLDRLKQLGGHGDDLGTIMQSILLPFYPYARIFFM